MSVPARGLESGAVRGSTLAFMAGVPFRGTPDRQSAVAERWRTLHLAPHLFRFVRSCKECRRLAEKLWAGVAAPLTIEKAFGVSMDTLMRMQNSFDIAKARSREGEIKVDRYVPKAKDSAEPKLA